MLGVQNFGLGGIFSVFFVEIPGRAISGLCSRSGRSQSFGITRRGCHICVWLPVRSRRETINRQANAKTPLSLTPLLSLPDVLDNAPCDQGAVHRHYLATGKCTGVERYSTGVIIFL